jgi:thiol-disulfide isomerase/thioredoxin
MERRAPPSGKGGLSGFATTIIIIFVCLLIGGGIYYFINRTETTPEVNNVANTSALSMSNVAPQSITETSATITWKTDKPASGQVNFGKTEEYGSMAQDTNFSTSHSVALIGLEPNTPYFFEAMSIDADGNKKTHIGELTTLRTATAAADTLPPTISGVAANTTESSAIVTWITDEPTTGQVKYSKDGQNTSTTPENTNLTVSHSVTLSNLDSGTTYTFTIISKDASGNPATSTSNQTFITLTPIPVGTQVGNRAFTLQNLDGQNVTLSSYRGKIVMINFWAVWCQPCVEELPAINAVSKEWANTGVVVLPIASNGRGETVTLVEQYINNNNYNFPQILFDANGQAESLYGVVSLPTTFFINADGVIKKIQADSFPNQAAIESILNTIQ